MSDPAHFADWIEIANLKAAYCRLLDTKDWDGWGALFTDDIHLDVTGSGGGTMDGRVTMVASVRGSIGQAKTAHQVHSPEIIIDGDRASAVWAMQDRLIWEDGRTMTGWGHYHEEYCRTAEGWRICRQRLTRLFMEA